MEALAMGEHLKEAQRAVEVFQLREVVALEKLRRARQRVGVVRAALNRLHIPEISLADDEDRDYSTGNQNSLDWNFDDLES
jgi:hypothetical protein